MSRFSVVSLPLAGLKRIERQRLCDSRGFLSRLFCAGELAQAGWCKPVAQINHTRTYKQGAVRGMHFQRPPYAEMKLVTCMRGRVWDVAVDIRAGSATFLKWHAEELSDENNRSMLIPEGFAHGFQALTNDVELLYMHSASYHAEAEGGLNPRDASLGVRWPLAVSEISERDQAHPAVAGDFPGITLS